MHKNASVFLAPIFLLYFSTYSFQRNVKNIKKLYSLSGLAARTSAVGFTLYSGWDLLKKDFDAIRRRGPKLFAKDFARLGVKYARETKVTFPDKNWHISEEYKKEMREATPSDI